ncbi:unnamed protein product [Fraxinus pennsylvanica]|uniref:Uncharacterized protein n=1 Tax=Fraxinus pennsylvanica TaxID=56036 RepID=A0AAD2A1J9_9LAMI|nr:unnamed protein product [Fraxinus pennsylvanica]
MINSDQVGEVGELSEIFQWKGEVDKGLPNWEEADKEHLGEELSDVLLYLIRFPKLVQSINCKSSKSWHFALHRSIQFSPFQLQAQMDDIPILITEQCMENKYEEAEEIRI